MKYRQVCESCGLERTVIDGATTHPEIERLGHVHDWRLLSMVFAPHSKQRNIHWSSDPAEDMWLLTPTEVDLLPDGITVRSIVGETLVVGRNSIDTDTRGGYCAVGLTEQDLAEWRAKDPLHDSEERERYAEAKENLRSIQSKLNQD
jgi:hypothetical protein